MIILICFGILVLEDIVSCLACRKCIFNFSLSVITLEVTTTEQKKITVSENEWPFFTMNEEEITYLTDVFGKRNIEFVCEIQPDEEIDEDEEF